MNKFCDTQCKFLDKTRLFCMKYNRILALNIELKKFKCAECLEVNNEGTNSIGHSK